MIRREIVKKVLNLIPHEKIFLLEGELGSGKTFLIKKIAQQLKIKGEIVSPTFILWQKYELKLKGKKYFLNHLDLYRIEAKNILKIGLAKELKKKENIFFIEWGDKLKPFLKKNKLKFVSIKIERHFLRRNYFLQDETFSS